MTINLSEISPQLRQSWLQHAIAPRPICFASTVNREGQVNLSPFSFFNLFSNNPPIIVFSPSRKGRDNTTKHTYNNVLEVPEVVVNMVDYAMVQQMSLASCEFPAGINEFEKAGFTPVASQLIQPPRVRESKVQMECRVLEVKPLGTEGGAGNLVIAEVLLMHVDESILNAESAMIDQQKFNLVARMGGNWYSRITPEVLFEVEKPNTKLGMGVDALPSSIRLSHTLTGNHLGQLANLSEIPDIDPAFDDDKLKQIFQYYSINPDEMEKLIHHYAAELLDQHKVQEAWQVLLATA